MREDSEMRIANYLFISSVSVVNVKRVIKLPQPNMYTVKTCKPLQNVAKRIKHKLTALQHQQHTVWESCCFFLSWSGFTSLNALLPSLTNPIIISMTRHISDSKPKTQTPPKALLYSSVNRHTYTHTHKHPQIDARGKCAHISPATVKGYSLLSCSASSNIFSACCICTHWNHVITACQGFLCRGTFAYSNALRSEACHGWFANVHIHTVDLCTCSALLMVTSGSLFLPLCSLDFHNKTKRRALACICVPPPAYLLRLCMCEFPHSCAHTHFWFTACLLPTKRHYRPTNKR